MIKDNILEQFKENREKKVIDADRKVRNCGIIS